MLAIHIINDGRGTPDVASYHIRITINTHLIASGLVKKFFRRDGWRKLAHLAIDAAVDIPETV